LFVCFLDVAWSIPARFGVNDRKEFLTYMKQFGKTYKPDEIPARFKAFLENKQTIQKLQADARKRGLDTKFGYTKFSDMTSDEFAKYYLGYKPKPHAKAPTKWESMNVQVPNSFDWRNQGAVTPIKDQGQCGSCWAFSATEGVESGYFLCTKKLYQLAPQQVVDCDTSDSGCNGGDLPTAFGYIQQNGMEPATDYPYTAEDGTCQFNAGDVVAKISGFSYATQSDNETAMQIAMASSGPLSICVDASSWQNYNGGVITSCGDSLDHCVQAVGWNQDSSNTPYWIVRNSWGTDWGINGYVYVERNQDECGIAEEATYIDC